MRAFVVDEPRAGALRALNYAPAIERIRRAGSSSARPLREIVQRFGPAYGTVFTRLDCHPDYGIELLSQSDMFAAEPRGRVIRRDSMREPDKHLIERGQVLIAGAGTLGENELYGRAILADERLAGRYVGPDSMTLVFEDPDDDFSLFAYAWLASPTGVQAIRSTSYGTKILRFRSELLSSLPVPMASSSVVSRVAQLVRRTASQREQYVRDLAAARASLEELEDVRSASELCAERRRQSILWGGPFPTLSAWTFASTAGALALLSSRWDARLGDVVESHGIYRGGRGARIPCSPPHGIDFLSQRDAFLIRPLPQRVLPPSANLTPRAGTILVAGQGTLGEGEIFGHATLVTASGARSAWTEHMLRIVPKEGEEALLYAYLTTTVGLRLLRSTAVGTKLLSLRPDLLERLPIPTLAAAKRRRIEGLIQAGLRARAEADEAESEAIRIIEEEVLPKWLA